MLMHEVGHTLGLAHNFKGSMARTWEQTQDKEYTQVSDLKCVIRIDWMLDIQYMACWIQAAAIAYMPAVFAVHADRNMA